MNRTLLLFLLLISLWQSKAKCEIFIYKGDTVYFHSTSPLEQYPRINALRPKLAGYALSGCFDCEPTPYNAEWTIINNELYLTNIYSASLGTTHLKADLNSLFNVNNGRVKADWVTQSLWIPINKEPIAWADIMTPIYSKERLFSFVNGEIKGIAESPISQESIYMKNQDSLKKFIYTHIDWSKIPDLDRQVKRIFIQLQTGVSAKAENIQLVRGTNEAIYDNEALRIISILPWSVYYRHGKVFNKGWTIAIIFSEANRDMAKNYR